MLNTSKLKIVLAAAAVGAAACPAFASNVTTIESQASSTAATLDSGAIVTAVGSAAGTGDGFTYTNYSIIVQDSTGSIDLFGHLPAGGYVPAVGDILTATGTYSPFNAIPEIGSLTSLTKISSGNPVPAPTVATVAQLSTITSTSFNYLGYYLELSNVLLSQQNATNPVPGNFPVHANGTYNLTDVGGTTNLIVFQQASSYSTAGALGGTTVPTGPVNVFGIVDLFSGTPEFIPFAITPEPASLGLVGVGMIAMLARKRRA